MQYYPKSQIKSNLFTNGKEYSLSSTKEEYTGYYYKISNGNKYTVTYRTQKEKKEQKAIDAGVALNAQQINSTRREIGGF